jgi:phage/plasmid-associated DNA primase
VLQCFSTIRCKEYKTWYETLQAIVNVYGHEGEGHEAALQWSKTVPNVFPGEMEFDRMWHRLVVRPPCNSEPRLGMGSLIHWARVDSPGKLDALELDWHRPIVPEHWLAPSGSLKTAFLDLLKVTDSESVAQAMAITLDNSLLCASHSRHHATWVVLNLDTNLWEVTDAIAVVDKRVMQAVCEVVEVLLWWACKHTLELEIEDIDEVRARLYDLRSRVRNKVPDSILLKLQMHVRDLKAIDKLDSNPLLVPFTNGTYDLQQRTFREYNKNDMVSRTLAYEYSPRDTIDLNMFQRVERMYEQWCPLINERNVLKRLAGYALSGDRADKKIGLLIDHRDGDLRAGDNGKSQLLRFWEKTLEGMVVCSKTSLLYSSGRTTGLDAHNAGKLAFAHKRLATFDELSPTEKLDTEQVKRCLTGGSGVSEEVRALGERNTSTMRWTILGMIACNRANFPQISSTDASTTKRFITIPFRSKFVDNVLDFEGQVHVFPVHPNMDMELMQLRMAHMHLMIDWYHNHYQIQGLSDESLPLSCLELRKDIFARADVVAVALNEFLDEHIVDACNGEETFVKRMDILKRFREDRNTPSLVAKASAADLKLKLDEAMARRGHVFRGQVRVNREKCKDGYVGVMFDEN